MFERYTEHARRCIFFARYEASQFGSPEITAEQLLLGILREEMAVGSRLDPGAPAAIRKELERLAQKRERVSTSVDLPLSPEAKRALVYAAEEAERLHHKLIDAQHLVLGLLRVEDSLAAELLQKHGMALDRYREIVAEECSERPAASHQRKPPPGNARAESLEAIIHALEQLVDNTAARLRGEDAYGDQRLKRKPWTRKEAIGHLIDWAIAHQQWLTRALMDPRLAASGYPAEAAVAVQHYAEFSWTDTVDLWVLLNHLLIHLLLRVPEEKVDTPCRIGIAAPVTLLKLMEAYVEHCQDIVGQILARLE